MKKSASIFAMFVLLVTATSFNQPTKKTTKALKTTLNVQHGSIMPTVAIGTPTGNRIPDTTPLAIGTPTGNRIPDTTPFA